MSPSNIGLLLAGLFVVLIGVAVAIAAKPLAASMRDTQRILFGEPGDRLAASLAVWMVRAAGIGALLFGVAMVLASIFLRVR